MREDGALTLVNSVRLDDAGLAALDALGKVTNVVRLGAMRSRLIGLGAVALIALPAVVRALVKFLSMEPYY